MRRVAVAVVVAVRVLVVGGQLELLVIPRPSVLALKSPPPPGSELE